MEEEESRVGNTCLLSVRVQEKEVENQPAAGSSVDEATEKYGLEYGLFKVRCLCLFVDCSPPDFSGANLPPLFHPDLNERKQRREEKQR